MLETNPGQCIIMGVPGPTLTDGIRDLIRQVTPGGFILFGRNLETPEQTFKLIAELHSLCRVPPVITVDQEGGRVARLKSFAGLPVSGHELAQAGSADFAAEHGRLTGELLNIFGFNLNLAPVIDYSVSEERDNSLRGRCLGTSPDEVIRMASAFLQGMEGAGVLGTVKHFPGYTYCENDPHGDLPLISRSLEVMLQDELRVFRFFLEHASSVMVGHGYFTHWHHEEFPASLSPQIIAGLLREDWNYDGLVMTDDLEMGAIAQRFGAADASCRAVAAGNDMLLICHNPACALLAREALDEVDAEVMAKALKRIQAFKAKLNPSPVGWDAVKFESLKAQTEALRRQVQQQLANRS
ncbi:MAG: glycoside hydrolase family 3 N-terminal domain-containing protein [Verrucomicrobiota bacterium]